MSDNRSLPIRERGFENYKDEIARLHSVIKQRQTKDLDTIEEHREPLSVEEKKEVTILLSWGGPSDGFKLWLDSEGEVLEGYYFFADWFEYEEYRLSDHELESVLEVFLTMNVGPTSPLFDTLPRTLVITFCYSYGAHL